MKWININDKLPPKNKDIIVCWIYEHCNNIESTRIYQIIDSITAHHYLEKDKFYHKISHWMLIPEFTEETND